MTQRKKKPKRKQAGLLPLAPEEESLVASLLDELDHLDPCTLVARVTTPAAAQNLAQKLPAEHEKTLAVLDALSRSFSEKGVRKSVKKALFRLRKKGVSISADPTRDEKEPLLRPASTVGPLAFLSGIDGEGNRAVFLALPQLPTGFEVGMGIVNDEQGMLQFQSGSYSKKRMKELKALFCERVGVMVNASLPHAAAVIEHAYSRTIEKTVEAPPDYLSIRPRLLNDVTLPERPAVYDIVRKEDVSDIALTDRQLERLFSHSLFESWIFLPEDIRPLLEALDGVVDSPIVLTEAQVLDRERELKEKWIGDYFNEERRATLKYRLEEAAYVIHELGEKELTLTALAAAGSLASRSGLIAADPLPAFLLNWSLDIYRRAMKETPRETAEVETAPSSILVP